MRRQIFVGWDPREADAFAVCRSSIRRYLTQPVSVRGLVLDDLKAKGLYRRPMEWRQSAADRPVMWDTISDAPMSTEHACSRFLVREIAGSEGWALFLDGDILCRGNIMRLFDQLSPQYAMYCVKHNYSAKPGVKMDAQIQTSYSRKNWSSVFAVNLAHQSNKRLTLDLVNSVPGRDLHRFCWLKDEEIGELGPEWNYLISQSTKINNPMLAHFTLGTPSMIGFEKCEFSDEWREELNRWAA